MCTRSVGLVAVALHQIMAHISVGGHAYSGIMAAPAAMGRAMGAAPSALASPPGETLGTVAERAGNDATRH